MRLTMLAVFKTCCGRLYSARSHDLLSRSNLTIPAVCWATDLKQQDYRRCPTDFLLSTLSVHLENENLPSFVRVPAAQMLNNQTSHVVQ
jgi:hypothetical protein